MIRFSCTKDQRDAYVAFLRNCRVDAKDQALYRALCDLLADAPNIEDGSEQPRFVRAEPGAGWGTNPHPGDKDFNPLNEKVATIKNETPGPAGAGLKKDAEIKVTIDPSKKTNA